VTVRAKLALATAVLAVAVPAAPVAVSATAALSKAPPGATARCRDGTYSYAQHRSGTCSHHGGVAQWLTGSGSSSGDSGGTGVKVGRTVPLALRTRTAGCVLGVLPDRRCSPGAYSAGLSKTVLCSSGFHTSAIRNVPQSEKDAVEREYGLPAGHYGRTLEIDHIVPLELGGSNAMANLFPERQPGYHTKDRLENEAHRVVCSGSIGLRAAQRAIAANWKTLYQRVFGNAP
jgi:hypothetical protein